MELQGPVALPEEAASTPVPRHPMRSVSELQPIAEIIDQFLKAVHDHPDAHLLTTTLSGPADEAEAQTFPDAPVRSLRIDAIRIIRRTSTEIVSGGPKQRKQWQDDVIAGMTKVWEEQRKEMVASGNRRGHREELAAR